MTYEEVLGQLPKHLRHFCVPQNYPKYTPLNQACWRFVMRQHFDYLSQHAHPAYLEGLKKTGIGIEAIASIEEMNQKLGELGWKAVVVDGFVPPSIFMEFNSHRILPIAADIRTFEHILYTPAPDIIHEAAGHAPIIADPVYADYLQKIGEYGAKALFHRQDFEVYEAIRHLSMLKEFPNADPAEIERALVQLEEKVKANTLVSEATLISRLHWWTVEYGLIGQLERPLLYGAGLLSSLAESRSCLLPDVRKIPLSIDCTQYSYDVTRPQPQLFVAKNFDQLFTVLEELTSQMSFRLGGKVGLNRAQESENWATVELSSGLQISGVLKRFIGEGDFVAFAGPCALSFQEKELPQQDCLAHPEGFSSPLGLLQGLSKPFELHSPSELSRMGLDPGNKVELKFQSGFSVRGRVKEWVRRQDKLIILRMVETRVISPHGELLYQGPGVYDLAVGEKVSSVFAGPAERQKHAELFLQSQVKTYQVKYSTRQEELHQLFLRLRKLRQMGTITEESLLEIQKGAAQSGSNWLLQLELLECLAGLESTPPWGLALREELEHEAHVSSDKRMLIEMGLALLERKS